MNNNFSNFKPLSSLVVGIQEWTGFLQKLNLLLNQMFNSAFCGEVSMYAGTASVTIQGVTPNSCIQANMEVGGTQTGFLQVKCTLNTVTITSTVNTDTGLILYSGSF